MAIIRCRSSFAGRPDRDVAWPSGLNAFEALKAGGQPIASSCSGATVCARCTVQVLDGAENVTGPQEDERTLLSRRAEPGERLACRLWDEGTADVIVLRAHYW